MRAEDKVDGIFSDQHAVAKFLVGNVGEIKSLRSTRIGIVIFECKNWEQQLSRHTTIGNAQ